MKGFSEQNLRSIRYWYQFYEDYLNLLTACSEFKKVEEKIKTIPFYWRKGIDKGKNEEDTYKGERPIL